MAALPLLEPRVRRLWRGVQALFWVLGAGIVAALLWQPEVGLHAFWDVLIPAAPALVVFAPGLWRNVCPLASTALFLRHTDRGARRLLAPRWQGRFALWGVALLFAIVPLRHPLLDFSGPATAIVLLSLAGVAVLVSGRFEWKSGWCSGLCPVHQVERLYGQRPAITPPNAHCALCARCVRPCADSTPGLHPLSARRSPSRTLAGLAMIGGFPGFIWGWFQVRDGVAFDFAAVYGSPLLGALATLTILVLARSRVPAARRPELYRLFAAAAVACYYWYRLPMLFGFGPFPGDGMLLDLRGVVPAWIFDAARVATSGLFLWWLVARRPPDRAPWLTRPAFAAGS